MNLMCHIPKSTPTQFLEIALDLCPLHLFGKMEALKTHYRLHQVLEFDWEGVHKNKVKTYCDSHLKVWKDYAERIGIDVNKLDECAITAGGKLFKVDQSSFAKAAVPTAEICLYTDGSKMDKRVGAGYVAINDEKVVVGRSCRRLEDSTTVFQAEISAIQMAAEYIKDSSASCLLYTSPSPRDS